MLVVVWGSQPKGAAAHPLRVDKSQATASRVRMYSVLCAVE